MTSVFHNSHAGMKPEQESKYMTRHFITEMPHSMNKVKDMKYGLAQIEQALHFRLTQIVSREFDRFSEIMKLLKIKSKRHATSDDDSLSVYRSDFHHLLTLLNVFAPREAADMLFDKYDHEGRGCIPIHSFVTRCRPRDYGPVEWHTPVMPNKATKQGQKLYPDTKNFGVPVQAMLPNNHVYKMTVNKMCQEIKKKMQQNSTVGKTNSDPRARRNLARQFEYYDPQHSGNIDVRAVQLVLNKINYPLENPQIALLMEKFGTPEGFFNYQHFVHKCYPEVEEERTSLPMGREHGEQLWAFMNMVDADGDGTVSLDEMLKYTKGLAPVNTPPPATPCTPSHPQNNMMSQIANMSTKGMPVPQRVRSRPPSQIGSQTMVVQHGPPYVPQGPRPPSEGSRTSRVPSRSASRGANFRHTGAMTARGPSSRGRTPVPVQMGRSMYQAPAARPH